MKAILLKSTSNPDQSFSIEDRKGFAFNYPYHFHTDYELTLIIKGKGTRLVGNNISSFSDWDMILLGENLPHHWHSDIGPASIDNLDTVRAIVLKFPASFNGIQIFDLPEHRLIKQLLENASKGIRIFGDTSTHIFGLLEKLLQAEGPERIILLLNLLDFISKSSEQEIVANSNYDYNFAKNEMDRMNKVYDYIVSNYLGSISQVDAARIANMNVSAFCRYFKRRYGKTFIQVVSEVRINHACRKLSDAEINIAEVCYQSGFNNLSNFNKMFRRIMKLSPSEYQLKISKQS